MRYAIYFTPERDDPLARLAASWLGRNAFTGEASPPPTAGQLSQAEMAFHTAAARRYGFHATLKAPFHLAEGESERDLIAAVETFCEQQDAVSVPSVVVKQLDGFFAIVPRERSAELDRLAADTVRAFERFRAPLSDAELARRNPDNLTPAQLKNLHQWGYPHVFEEFRFHMTLTGRVDPYESAKVAGAVDAFFGPLLLEPLQIDTIALFVEPEPGAPFQVRATAKLGRTPQRKTA